MTHSAATVVAYPVWQQLSFLENDALRGSVVPRRRAVWETGKDQAFFSSLYKTEKPRLPQLKQKVLGSKISFILIIKQSYHYNFPKT